MGLEITMLCDRKTTNAAKSQMGFIDFVVKPYFDALSVILPEMSYTINQMKDNKDAWALLADQYEKQKEETGNENI